MTDEEDEQRPSPYLATRATPKANYQSLMRQSTGVDHTNNHVQSFDSEPGRMELGMWSEDQQPTVWDAVNYPHEEEFQFESFYLRYERQSEARAIIDKPVNDTWQDDPTVHDEAHLEEDEAVSAFEQKCREFLEGEHTRRKPIHRLNVLDRLARLGHYSILVLGTADGRELHTPLYEGEFDGLDDLNYLATFAEDRIVNVELNSDMTSERFRLPQRYEVVTKEIDDAEDANIERDESETETIHWSRVIHVPEGSLETDSKGTPALKPVFHELLNIDKIKAASSEGYWRAGYQGLLIQPPEDPTSGQRMRFSDDGEGVEQEIQEFLNNFQRTIRTRAEVSSLDSTVSNPQPHLEANYQSIAAALDIPKAILTGEDRADTGNSQDVRQWHQKIGQRRNTYAEPVIVEPLFQRMIEYGLLPDPEGDGFEVEWPPLDEMTEAEEADLHATKANTLATLAPSADVTELASIAELRQVVGWGPEVGSEVDVEYQPNEDELESDEEQLDVSESVSLDGSQQEDDGQQQEETDEAEELREALDEASA